MGEADSFLKTGRRTQRGGDASPHQDDTMPRPLLGSPALGRARLVFECLSLAPCRKFVGKSCTVCHEKELPPPLSYLHLDRPFSESSPEYRVIGQGCDVQTPSPGVDPTSCWDFDRNCVKVTDQCCENSYHYYIGSPIHKHATFFNSFKYSLTPVISIL